MRVRLIGFVAMAAGLLVTSSAVAQGKERGRAATAQAKGVARELADKGWDFYDAGDFKEALKRFEEAEAKYHAPTIVLMIARCHERLGQLIEARAAYRRLLAEDVDPKAPRAFIQARAEAKAELTALTERIPSVEIAVLGAPLNEVEVTLDGQPVKPGARIDQDPGERTVVVTAPGRRRATRTIALREGARERVTIDLGAQEAPAPSRVAGEKRSAPAPDNAPATGSLVPAYFAFGLGGAALAIGATTGGLVFGRVGEIERVCGADRVCPKEQQSSLDAARTLATVSTISFALSGAAVAAGVVLVLVRPGGAGGSEHVGLTIAPGSVSVAGRF